MSRRPSKERGSTEVRRPNVRALGVGLISIIVCFLATTYPAHADVATPVCDGGYNPSQTPVVFDPTQESAEYSAEGFLIYHFHLLNQSQDGNLVYFSLSYRNDHCNGVTGYTFAPVTLTAGITDMSIHFVSMTTIEVWDDTHHVLLQQYGPYDGYIPSYFNVTPFARDSQFGSPVYSGHSYDIKENGTAPIVENKVDKPANCTALGGFTNNAMFDFGYERAEYIGGLLRVHLRFDSTFIPGAHGGIYDFRSGVVPIMTDDCAQSFPFNSLSSARDPLHVWYYSYRMTSPTHWVLWDDEHDTSFEDQVGSSVCGGCSGDIPANAKYVYFWAEQNPNDWMHTTPFPPLEPATTTPACTVNCNSNVMFLPGIEGSRLYSTDNGGAKLWESDDQSAQQLVMNPDGTSQKGNVYTRDVLNTINILGFPLNIYKSFIGSLDNLKSSGAIVDWEAVPYDWRLSLDQIVTGGRQISADGDISYIAATSSPYIIQELRNLAATSRTKKVTIVAHSNGGLVAKRLTEILGPTESAKLIDKMIFVAVPQIGTSQGIEAILDGKDEAIPSRLSAPTARYLAQNMPMSYNLLPSTNYFTFVDDPVISFDPASTQDWIATYGTAVVHSTDRLSAFLLDSTHNTTPTPSDVDLITPPRVNSTLFNVAMQTHEDLDLWTPPQGVQFFLVAGWGNETLSGITYKREKQNVCIATDISGNCTAFQALPTKLTIIPNHVVDGDGTVVEPSALWTNGGNGTKFWLNLRPEGLSHYNIFESPSLIALFGDIISGANNQAPDISTSEPTSIIPSRLHFVLHSPLTIGFLDSQGNYAGSTATTTIFNIPGVEYERYGDVQWLSVPDDIAGQVILHGTASGSFTLDLEQMNSGTVASKTSFEGIPSGVNTVASIAVHPNQLITSNGVLAVDFNGDGTIDRILQANQGGVVLPDVTPPEAIVSVSTSTRDILVQGVDDVSPTTIVTKFATITTIIDQSANKTTLSFQKTFSGNIITYAKLASINYGTSTIPLPSSFLYVWDSSKTLVSQTVVANSQFVIDALYDKKKDKTTIVVLKKNVPIQTTIVAGLRLVKLTTMKGSIGYSW